MIKTILQFIVLFVALTLLQVVCNHICIFGVAIPVVYIYFLIRLPINLSVNWAMTLAFILGLTIDVFSNTQGMNALACVVATALRRPVFSLYFAREDDLPNPIPSIHTLGIGIYIKYLLSMVLIYCFFIFAIQAFTLHNVQLTIMRIVASTTLSTLLIFGIDSLDTKREKRL
ncbi:MAG: rod shape-determining protein MreD [Bacteroidales bacterium]|nr:rod shape-determining protein MreD [Bacteroidales bacterium]